VERRKASGMNCVTNAKIGTILGLSRFTVRKHLEHVYEKLGVKTRTAAAALAYGESFKLGRGESQSI
jgi:DNA-binding CsgD family transcriptional regulator